MEEGEGGAACAITRRNPPNEWGDPEVRGPKAAARALGALRAVGSFLHVTFLRASSLTGATAGPVPGVERELRSIYPQKADSVLSQAPGHAVLGLLSFKSREVSGVARFPIPRGRWKQGNAQRPRMKTEYVPRRTAHGLEWCPGDPECPSVRACSGSHRMRRVPRPPSSQFRVLRPRDCVGGWERRGIS